MMRQDDLLKEDALIQAALDEADRVAAQTDIRLDHEQVFTELHARIKDNKA
ncbi:hypothetical protein [Abiotrophia sp. HMSC24B09]|uniref:hypothetical protein n=1 Tax=Abiotrophia sp. HMSC24B09 TaxID=1581061 RepID=UPI0025BAE912|nr:hypothetical protein [Abiotrophia sp. HMSC24B09]